MFGALFFAPAQEVYAHTNLISDQQVKQLIEQATFLAQQGISKDEILCVFEQALVQEKLYSNKSDRNEKIIAVVAVGIVCLVIGGFICLAIKNAADEHAHRQQLEQNITNLDQQVAQAQLRLDQAHAHAREPRPAFAAGQETQY